jgi:DNA invertase Pin-like site-specific DNA recombinase
VPHRSLAVQSTAHANAYVERLIGSIRRECLDHVIVPSAAGLQRVLAEYVAYYMTARTHLSLDKDAPIARPGSPLSTGRVIAIPQVNGLVFGIFAAIAEFERELIRERVRSGIALARARGRRLGRPRRSVDGERVASMRAHGYSWRRIARELNVGIATAHAALSDHSKNLPVKASENA